MRPIVYEVHCQACHPLNYEPGAPDHKVPHRLSPTRMREMLTVEFGKRYLDNDAPGRPVGGATKPGGTRAKHRQTQKERTEPTLLPHKPEPLSDPRILAEIDAKVAKGEAELGRRSRCVTPNTNARTA